MQVDSNVSTNCYHQLNIVEEAKSWCGTQFHPQGRKKVIGCDCIGLILGIASAIGARSLTGQTWYQLDIRWYDCYHDSELLMTEMPKHFHKVFDRRENLGQKVMDIISHGDILLVALNKQQFHACIASDISCNRVKIIHSCASLDKVVEHIMPQSWIYNIVCVFRMHVYPYAIHNNKLVNC